MAATFCATAASMSRKRLTPHRALRPAPRQAPGCSFRPPPPPHRIHQAGTAWPAGPPFRQLQLQEPSPLLPWLTRLRGGSLPLLLQQLAAADAEDRHRHPLSVRRRQVQLLLAGSGLAAAVPDLVAWTGAARRSPWTLSARPAVPDLGARTWACHGAMLRRQLRKKLAAARRCPGQERHHVRTAQLALRASLELQLLSEVARLVGVGVVAVPRLAPQPAAALLQRMKQASQRCPAAQHRLQRQGRPHRLPSDRGLGEHSSGEFAPRVCTSTQTAQALL
mmetsp:Transcript_51631/g.93013  ORF Transcript_51631/g.93013 Transcript_51631/m.93013 type:complete len:278 (-) Transcript_51631:1191-2024(-)